MSVARYKNNGSGPLLWDCNCGFRAGANPERYLQHQDSGSCPVWPGFKLKRLPRNRLGGLKAPAPGGYPSTYKGMTA